MEPDSDNTDASRPEDASATSGRSSHSFLRRPKAETFAAPARGFIPVLLILVLFLLAAIFVKPLFFGILAAVLSFKFEQFLERRFFGTRFMRGVHAFLVKVNAPFAAFRRRITLRFGDAPAPDENAGSSDGAISVAERRRIATRASAMTVILVVVVTVLLACTAGYFIKPFASKSGKSMCYRCDDACEVGKQAAGNGVTGLDDAHAAEVDGEDVEGSIRRALEDTAQATNE